MSSEGVLYEARVKPFTDKQRVRHAGGKTSFGHRPTNAWQGGDLPAPWAIGDLVRFVDGAQCDRLNGMEPSGYFVVHCAYSIDDGDAWYFRVTNGVWGSHRLHVAFADRASHYWTEDVDWMASFELIDTADPEGLALRESKLAAGWSFNEDRCPTCGRAS